VSADSTYGGHNKGAPSLQTVRPIMPDALPALHLSDAINPSGIFEARLKQIFCTRNVTELHPISSKLSKVDAIGPLLKLIKSKHIGSGRD
jgi:hypothetical protein